MVGEWVRVDKGRGVGCGGGWMVEGNTAKVGACS